MALGGAVGPCRAKDRRKMCARQIIMVDYVHLNADEILCVYSTMPLS